MAKQYPLPEASNSWDGVADWYAGWSGPGGSFYHRKVVLPTAVELLQCDAGQRIVDLGCGPGALARWVAGEYVGVDLSRKLIRIARKHNTSPRARFLVGDVTQAGLLEALGEQGFDGAVFLLSLQDIHPLTGALVNAAKLLRPGGRLVAVMMHPCFRIPRQSGWGWDGERKLRYRRVDHYLSPLSVPMQRYRKGKGATRSFHRPLSDYINGLSQVGLLVDALREIPVLETVAKGTPPSRADRRTWKEIPLFMALRAVKQAVV
ncbi:hypothetical protein CAI21_10745 [Alkalilimnicola ehrlichii]|uniref:Methyltransferase type 11 domain-containing protein n=1 Tax=Alkalilimnicola ehrlichii TaxID=351052 RepID=A0A3E0WW41_9GAMM|nr:class I SAM-dependent methyltransferase [Alkalilimnicola ehrlichii]RFA29235.1 hypothetical protein CAI21_10745 [Alkalilimnicola ehrlichii]RFA36147.1 hypothetical protein CAL65_11895 [Alkalilimnicola ehrlichii]